MHHFVWSATFETGIEHVDEQHRGLVDRINSLGAYLEAEGRVGMDTGRLFDEIASYTEQHFADEERMVAEVGLDQRHQDEHRLAHQDFCDELGDLRVGLLEGDMDSAKRLHSYLTHWLAYHILGVDQRMAAQVEDVSAGMMADAVYEAEVHARNKDGDPMLVALNGMHAHITERNRELTHLNRTLEAKVAERTRELREANRHLEALSLTDTLTGLPNRRHGLMVMRQHWRDGGRLSCMMIDVDHFKEVNDTHGHGAGDAVLVELARTLVGAVRNDDLVCRLGGDEFLVVCPATGAEDAALVADKLWSAVSLLRVPTGDGVWPGSISVGLAERGMGMVGPEDLIHQADEAVYEAKKAGKNRVRLAGDAA